MDPLTLMAVGTFTQIMGQYGANIQQAIAERANAAFYREQAEYAQLAADRAQEIAAFDYTHKIGEQLGAYASGGVDMSGSASITVGATISNAIREIYSLKKKGEIDVRLATLRKGEAQRTGEQLASPGYNLIQGGSTLLKEYGSYKRSQA